MYMAGRTGVRAQRPDDLCLSSDFDHLPILTSSSALQQLSEMVPCLAALSSTLSSRCCSSCGVSAVTTSRRGCLQHSSAINGGGSSLAAAAARRHCGGGRGARLLCLAMAPPKQQMLVGLEAASLWSSMRQRLPRTHTLPPTFLTCLSLLAACLPPCPPRFLQIFVPPHPLIKHWLGVMRSKDTPSAIFRSAAAGGELGSGGGGGRRRRVAAAPECSRRCCRFLADERRLCSAATSASSPPPPCMPLVTPPPHTLTKNSPHPTPHTPCRAGPPADLRGLP